MKNNCKDLLSILIVGIVMFSTIIVVTDFQLKAASNSDGTNTVDGANSPYYISGSEKYNVITIKSNGKLIINSSGQLDVTTMILENGSIVEINGGSLTLTDDDDASGDVALTGSCKYFNLTNGAELFLTGRNGNSVLTTSKGGDAFIWLNITQSMSIIDSTIKVKGGKGGNYNSNSASILGDLITEEYAGAGGDAKIILNYIGIGTGQILIFNSTLNATGGDAGSVTTGNGASSNGISGAHADGTSSSPNGGTAVAGGTGGTGGNGGTIEGFVGSGGNAEITISVPIVSIEESELISNGGNAVSVKSGNGGTALGGVGGHANGFSYLGYTTQQNGGIGGTGGNGGAGGNGGDGGTITEFSGTGGDALINVSGSSVEIINSNLTASGGDGVITSGNGGAANGANGNSGNGGRGADGGNTVATYNGGDGGNGKAGGNGGNGGVGGDGGLCSGNAGSGGNAKINVYGNNLIIKDSNLKAKGGDGSAVSGSGSGANAGSGGSANGGRGGNGGLYKNGVIVYGKGGDGGDGGTGGSNGGGDGGDGGMGGNGGPISENSGSGGISNITLSGINAIISSSLLSTVGGSGSLTPGSGNSNVNGGNGGTANGGNGGTSGSGPLYYGSPGSTGTTGSAGSSGTPGTSGSSLDSSGFGGNSNIYLSITTPTILDTISLNLNGGTGQSTGGTFEHIPMSFPRLYAPADNLETRTLLWPTFYWTSLYDSTTNGVFSYYEFQIDDNIDFLTLYDTYSGAISKYKPTTDLPDGVYYWRVCAHYQTPVGVSPGWSDVFKLTIDKKGVEFSDSSTETCEWYNELDIECSINISDNIIGIDGSTVEYCISTTDPSGFGDWENAGVSVDQLTMRCAVIETFAEGVDNYIKWQARDLLTNGPEQSEECQIKLDITQPSLTIQFPPDNLSLHNNSPVFQWSSIDTLSGLNGNYRIQFAQDPGYSNLIHDIQFQAGTINDHIYNFVLPGTIDNGLYYWRIRTQDNASNWCDYSSSRKLYIDMELPINTLLTPSNNTFLITGQPVFNWRTEDQVSGLTNITQIQISTNADFQDQNIIIEENVTHLSFQSDTRTDRGVSRGEFFIYEYQPPEALPDDIYYWRVRAQDNTLEWSEYSESNSFMIDTTPPTNKLHSPKNDGWNKQQPILRWQAFDQTSGLSGKYHVQIRNDPEFTNITWERDITGSIENNIISEYDVMYNEFELGKNYYWRVRALDNAGHWGSYTDTWKFKIDNENLTMSDLQPAEWVNKKVVEIGISIQDIHSGVLGESVQYTYSTTGVDGYGNWTSTNLTTNNAILNVTTEIELDEGINNYVKWRAKDVAENGYTESDDLNIRIDLIAPVFSDPSPSFDELQTQNSVLCNISISDLSSGVDCSSIQYRRAVEGLGTFGPWESTGLTGISKNFLCSFKITFPNGDNNYLQWRVKDVAGNGWVLSSEQRLNVSTGTPWLDDTDADKIPDDWEDKHGLDLLDPNDAMADLDNDGLNNLEEYQNNTDINDSDSDNDGLNDSAELRIHGTEPLNPDTDDDGYTDGEELEAETDPTNSDDHPGSSTEGKKSGSDKNALDFMLIILAIVIIMVLLLLFLLLRRKKAGEDDEAEEVEEEMDETEDEEELDKESEEWKFAYEDESEIENEDVADEKDEWKFTDDELSSDDFDLEKEIDDDLLFEDTELGVIGKKGKPKKGKPVKSGKMPKKTKNKVEDDDLEDSFKEPGDIKGKGKVKGKGKRKTKGDISESKSKESDKKAKPLGEPKLQISKKSVKCNICFGYIKPKLYMVTCGCGKRYHENCAKRLGVCPTCETSLKDPVDMTDRGKDNEEPTVDSEPAEQEE